MLSDGDGKGGLAMQLIDPVKGAIRGEVIVPSAHADYITSINMDPIGENVHSMPTFSLFKLHFSPVAIHLTLTSKRNGSRTRRRRRRTRHGRQRRWKLHTLEIYFVSLLAFETTSSHVRSLRFKS